MDLPVPKLGTRGGPSSVRFGNFELDLRAGHLRKRGTKLKLVKQSLEVLTILLEHAGETVTREELRRRLWPKDVFVDFENNLNTAVARLREVLGDSAEHPRFIETLPKRGYRFIASLCAPERKPRLMVLPFVNLSGDAAQEYFSDAITEEIISVLAGLAPEHLAVIARTTAMYYKGCQKPVAQIGREVSVEYIVEGSVRRAGERVVATVQLIRTADETHIWANRYDVEPGEVFNTEEDAARAIAAQLGVTPRRTIRRPTEDLIAYNLYIQGRYHLYRASPADFLAAKEYCEQAIARDPSFALAYDALAEIYWYWGFLGFVPPKDASSAGIFYALRALEIDSTLAETRALVALYRKGLDYCWPEVHRELQEALRLNPVSPIVRTRHAIGELLPQGRMDEAAAELQEALESDPLSPHIRTWLGMVLWLGRDYDGAIEQARILLELDPAAYMSHFASGLYYREKGMFEEAIVAHRKAVELSGGSPLMLGWLGLALGQSGKTAEVRDILTRLHAIAAGAYVPPTSFAWIHLALGETDQAFAWMDRAIEGGDQMIVPLKTYPFLDPIRNDPRYLTLLRKVHLEP